jgi:hypothetical protein
MKRNIRLGRVSLLPCGSLALLLCACGGGVDSHNLGDTAAGIEVSSAAPTTGLADFTGTWIGEAEDPLGAWQAGVPAIYHFPSGASEIHLDVRPALSSYLTFGGAPPPAAPDLDASYPPGMDYATKALWHSTALPPVEGFTYALDGEAFTGPGQRPVPDGVLHLSFASNEGLTPWCEAQTRMLSLQNPNAQGPFNCMGGLDWNYQSDADPSLPPVPHECDVDGSPVDCGKYFLCVGSVPLAWDVNPKCICNDKGCEVDGTPSSDLFLSRDGDDLIGVLSNSVFLRGSGSLAALGQIRFHRQ